MKPNFAKLFWMLSGIFVLLPVVVGEAHAASCVSTASVTASANLADNAAYKGHVGAHVKGEGTAGRTASSVGRAVYNSAVDFASIWAKLVSIDATDCPVNPGSNNVVVVRMTALQAGTSAVEGYNCSAVDGAEVSKCTAVTGQFTPANYYFQFQYKNTSPKLQGSNWVLNTAYPEQ
ncbi:MAG: hypothetical protein NUV50_13905 [Rhodospirillales bacterium]|nr:hypothetical protein [Rhodospirillales bacterium]